MIALRRRAASTAPLDQLDARLRLVAAVVLVLALATLRRPEILALAVLLGVLLTRAAGLAVGEVWRRFRHVEGVAVVLLVLVPWSVPGTPVLGVGSFAVTAEGVARAVVLALKINACLLVTVALIGGLEPTRVGRALAALGAPKRLVNLLLFVVRYLDLAQHDVTRLGEAMRARGFRARSSRRTWRGLAQGGGAVLLRAIARAERIEEAMRCRGFSGRLPLTAGAPLTLADGRAAMLVLATAAALVALDRWP